MDHPTDGDLFDGVGWLGRPLRIQDLSTDSGTVAPRLFLPGLRGHVQRSSRRRHDPHDCHFRITALGVFDRLYYLLVSFR